MKETLPKTPSTLGHGGGDCMKRTPGATEDALGKFIVTDNSAVCRALQNGPATRSQAGHR